MAHVEQASPAEWERFLAWPAAEGGMSAVVVSDGDKLVASSQLVGSGGVVVVGLPI